MIQPICVINESEMDSPLVILIETLRQCMKLSQNKNYMTCHSISKRNMCTIFDALLHVTVCISKIKHCRSLPKSTGKLCNRILLQVLALIDKE